MGSPVPSAEWNRLQCLTCYSFQVLLANWLLFPALWVCSQWCSSQMMLALPPMVLQGPVSPLLNAQRGLELPMEIVLQALECVALCTLQPAPVLVQMLPTTRTQATQQPTPPPPVPHLVPTRSPR